MKIRDGNSKEREKNTLFTLKRVLLVGVSLNAYAKESSFEMNYECQ